MSVPLNNPKHCFVYCMFCITNIWLGSGFWQWICRALKIMLSEMTFLFFYSSPFPRSHTFCTLFHLPQLKPAHFVCLDCQVDFFHLLIIACEFYKCTNNLYVIGFTTCFKKDPVRCTTRSIDWCFEASHLFWFCLTVFVLMGGIRIICFIEIWSYVSLHRYSQNSLYDKMLKCESLQI